MKREKSIEEMVEERGVKHCYVAVLSMMVWGELRSWADWRDSWATIKATPKQKRLAYEVACYVPDPKPQEAEQVSNG